MNETKSSTKILMVSLVLALSAAMFLGGYYFGKDSVICHHDSNLCLNQSQDETEEKTSELDEEETEVASQSVRDLDYEQLITDLGYSSELNQVITQKEYSDLTGDGTEEVVFSVHSGGTAGNIAVYVYGYQNGKLKQLHKEDEYSAYQFEIKNQNRLKITAINTNSEQNQNRFESDMEADVSKTYTWHNGQFVEM